MQMICDNPPIKKNSLNTKVVNALMRAGYAKTSAMPKSHIYDGLVFDWTRIKGEESALKKIRGLGMKGFFLVQEWLSLIEKEDLAPLKRRNDLLPELEQCVMDMTENGKGDMALMEIQIYFFLDCFGTYLEQDKANEIMLHVKQTAERFMCLGFN
jgi:hypothetical protein